MSLLSSGLMHNDSSLVVQQRRAGGPRCVPEARVRVLIVGARGFLGSALARRLLPDDCFSTVLGFRTLEHVRGCTDGSAVLADVTDPGSLRTAVAGTEWVIHTANYIGRDENTLDRVNVRGTSSLVDAARDAGARVLYISTTSVYGSGPFRGHREIDLQIAPVSMLSQSRARAEEMVLSAGGTVLRPHLTYGIGDSWFVPTLVRLVRELDGQVEGGRGTTSVIDVDVLAAAVGKILTAPAKCFAGTAFNATHPQAVSYRHILHVLRRAGGLAFGHASVSLAEAEATGKRIGLSAHQVQLLSLDHWFSSEALWSRLGAPGVDPFIPGELALAAYRRLLQGT